MRLLTYLLILIFISNCTTIEVTKEVVKVGTVVKEKVEEQFEGGKTEIVEDKTIVEEKQIITQEKKEEKTIVKTQQKLAQINFIGKKISEIKNEMGKPQLARSDGSIKMLRYDSKSCRLFLFFNLSSNVKRVEHFEFRDYIGELLNTKQSLESCYREYKLIS
tara:strand:- start:887 stop:1372 length:486 start_codon:yes stop_codon:yes gene_type:complete